MTEITKVMLEGIKMLLLVVVALTVFIRCTLPLRPEMILFVTLFRGSFSAVGCCCSCSYFRFCSALSAAGHCECINIKRVLVEWVTKIANQQQLCCSTKQKYMSKY